MGVQRTVYPRQREMGMATKEVTSELSLKGYRPPRKAGVSTSWGLPEEPYYKDIMNGKEFGI